MQTHAMILALNAVSLMNKLACGMKGSGLIGYLSFSQVENGAQREMICSRCCKQGMEP